MCCVHGGIPGFGPKGGRGRGRTYGGGRAFDGEYDDVNSETTLSLLVYGRRVKNKEGRAKAGEAEQLLSTSQGDRRQHGNPFPERHAYSLDSRSGSHCARTMLLAGQQEGRTQKFGDGKDVQLE